MHFIHELPPHSCSQHGPATAWLTLQWPREVTVIYIYKTLPYSKFLVVN